MVDRHYKNRSYNDDDTDGSDTDEDNNDEPEDCMKTEGFCAISEGEEEF